MIAWAYKGAPPTLRPGKGQQQMSPPVKAAAVLQGIRLAPVPECVTWRRRNPCERSSVHESLALGPEAGRAPNTTPFETGVTDQGEQALMPNIKPISPCERSSVHESLALGPEAGRAPCR